jgi:hypothetical protein
LFVRDILTFIVEVRIIASFFTTILLFIKNLCSISKAVLNIILIVKLKNYLKMKIKLLKIAPIITENQTKPATSTRSDEPKIVTVIDNERQITLLHLKKVRLIDHLNSSKILTKF